MGRHRVEIKKIENKAIRQVTFAKRRNGLLKKAYEISALCDIEVALLAFSPSGKPTIFGGKKRFDQIFARYINLPEHQEKGLEDLEVIADLVKPLHRLIDGMRRERNMYNHRRIGDEMYADAQMEEIQREMNIVGNQFEEVMTQLKYYEEIPSYIRTVSEMEAYEEFLRQTLNQIQMQKQALQTNHRAPQLVQNYLTAPLLEKLDVEVARGDQMLTGGGHGSMSRAMGVAGGGGTVGGNPTAMAIGGNSMYNTTNSNITVPPTSMLNFLDSNGPSTRNVQGQYMNNNGLLPHAPSFLVDHQTMERSFSGRPAPSKESEEVRNYYLDLARRLGLALPHEQNQTGRGGPGGPGGGAGSTSGQASFQATRDPRSG